MRNWGRYRFSRAAVGFVVVGFVQCFPGSSARTQTTNERDLVARHALLLTKALTYDSRILSRAGASMTLAVLFNPREATSKQEAEIWHERFAALQSLRFLGLPFSVIRVPFGSPADTRSFLREKGVDALMVCGGLDKELPIIVKITRNLKIISIASHPDQVARGLSMGVAIERGKNSLLFNLRATREEGALFTSDILKLAKVIK